METVFFILERIYRMTQIPVRYMDKTGEITLFCWGIEAKDDTLRTDAVLREGISNKLTAAGMPTLEFKDEFLYGAYKDAVECVIIFGPVKLKTLGELCAALAVVYFTLTGKHITEMDIVANRNDDPIIQEIHKNELQSYALENTEQEIMRYSFSDEISFMKHIREGSPEGVRKNADAAIGSFDRRIGRMAKKFNKQNEYMGVSAITLAARAAIDGGLDPLTSYMMSDIYLQRLENCKSADDIYKLVIDVMISYAERVKQQQKEGSQKSYVEECKNFIANHLNQPFTVDDIADKIGFNKSYLSRRFSEACGMGIQQYTRIKRVEAAANMLRFTEESILTISNYLCFTTQSHFGKIFKDQMGMTPQKYREKNKIVDIDNIKP